MNFGDLVQASKNKLDSFSGELKKDFSFINKNTELFTIWSFFYAIVAFLFYFATKNNLSLFFVVFLPTIVLIVTAVFCAIIYLHAIMYGNKNSILLKVHKKLNTSYHLPKLKGFELDFGNLGKSLKTLRKNTLKIAFK